MLLLNRIQKKGSVLNLGWLQVCAVLVAAYLLLTLSFGYLGYLENLDNRIRGHDSVYYYIYLRSVFIDRDLDFNNEWEHYYGSSEKRPYQNNVFSIGPTILWTPFFIFGHFITLLAQSLGSNIEADGYSTFYQVSVYIGNSLYGLLGVLLTALLLKTYLKTISALIACLGIMLASQLTYYFWSFTAMSHNTSFAATALFFYLWLTFGPCKRTALAAALMSLVRWQNVLFLLPLAIRSIIDLISLIRTTDANWKSWLLQHSVFIGVFFCGLIPQFAVWKLLYSKFILIPQGTGFISFSDLHLVSVLFSLRHGLFSWHPLLLIGFSGCTLLWSKDRVLALSLGIAFVLQWLLNSAVTDWWAGWSFGHRRFISLLPIFALGLGLVIEKIEKRAILVGIAVVFFAGIWNQLFIYQYIYGLIPRGGPLTYREMFVDKLYPKRRFTTQAAVNTAVNYLSKNDMDNFKKYARMAYEMSPYYRNSLLLYSLVCITSDNNDEGLQVFQLWYLQERDDILARWGFAEYLVKHGNFDQAAQLFRFSHRKNQALSKDIYSRIEHRENTLIDERFFVLYKDRFKNIYAE